MLLLEAAAGFAAWTNGAEPPVRNIQSSVSQNARPRELPQRRGDRKDPIGLMGDEGVGQGLKMTL
ncbi:MAG: hypothetical protein ABI318_10155 [Chthoniobacteraceae bacterium]